MEMKFTYIGNNNMMIGCNPTNHSYERLCRGEDLDSHYIKNIIAELDNKDLLLDIPINAKFSIVDEKNNVIIVFKNLLKRNSIHDIDLLIITFVRRSMNNYFGIEGLPVINIQANTISHGYEYGKKRTCEPLSNIDMFFRRSVLV